jgi:tetratricopeptide (TPR) repeat protein
MVLARLGDRQGALDAYDEALERSPDDPDVVYRRGEQLELMGRREEAIRAYERAASLAPSSYKPSLSLGVAHLQENDLEAAWAALAEAEARGDASGRALYDMGLVRERQGRLEEAVALFERSLGRFDRSEDMGLRHLGLARCLVQLQRPEVAEVHFRAAAELLEPEDAVPLERAEAWLRAGDPTRALTLLQRVRELDTSPRGQFIRARALLALGRREAARQAALRAAELEPDSEVYRRLHDQIQASP